MKKSGLISICAVLIALLFVSCSTKSPIQTVTDATASQTREIEKCLSEIDIVCSEISVSSSPSTNDLDKDWGAYDIIGTDNKIYMLILRKDDKDSTAILDADGNMLWGILDNTIWPSRFANR